MTLNRKIGVEKLIRDVIHESKGIHLVLCSASHCTCASSVVNVTLRIQSEDLPLSLQLKQRKTAVQL